MTDDEKLYQQYLAGDETAADELVARYGDTLTLYIHGFLGDLHEAEDLMIEAFALMFAKPRPVSEQGSFRGNAAQEKRSRNGLWCMANPTKRGETVYRPYKNESRQTAATVWRHAALRKTQTPSANSLTERPPKRKFFFSEFETRRIS